MKLYYYPGACSLAPHIILRETQLPFVLEKVDLSSHRTDSGEDFSTVNPNGYVPALRFDDGSVLTEAGVILQYLADQKPDAGLAPPPGSMERYRLLERLNFLSTEVHKQLAPFFRPNLPEQTRQEQLGVIRKRFDFLETLLGKQPFLLGEQFSIADAYLFTLLRWARMFKIDLAEWPGIDAYFTRVNARPAVQKALDAEGLAANH